MLKAEGKGQNKSFAFRFFVVMQHYECTIRPTHQQIKI
ncbi:unknown [Prevotella sp. CAG:1185]|nr:unknown [Prevotella sp. CAG:1185]